MKNFSNKRGFVKAVILIIAGLVLLKYIYDIDIVGFLTTGKFREFLDKGYQLASEGWEKYRETILRVWNYAIALIKKS
jgi:hypothetical protein